MSPIRKQRQPNQPVPEQRLGQLRASSDGSGSNGSLTSTSHNFSGNDSTCYNCGATRTSKPCTTFSSCIGPSQTSITLDEGVCKHCKPQGRGNVCSWRKMLEQTSSTANASITNSTTATAALPVSDLPLIRQHGHTLQVFPQSQQQKEKNIVKPPLDRDKLFTAVYTSCPAQPSWKAGLIAHPWIVPLPCCSTIDYSHYHLLQLLCYQGDSEDVGEVCPPTDDVSMMVPLPTSESQEAFSISLDDNNDENQNDHDMQAPECQICFNGRVQLIFIPCGHGTCQSCSDQLVMQHCPFCRRMVSDAVEIHY